MANDTDGWSFIISLRSNEFRLPIRIFAIRSARRGRVAVVEGGAAQGGGVCAALVDSGAAELAAEAVVGGAVVAVGGALGVHCGGGAAAEGERVAVAQDAGCGGDQDGGGYLGVDGGA